MQCCVCGANAGRWKQHWNRDTGYGICNRCALIQEKTETPEEVKSRYGIRGVNYGNPKESEMAHGHAHTHEHGPHTHTHGHEHHHGHDHPSKEELAVIEDTIKQIDEITNAKVVVVVKALAVFAKNIHKIYSPVDLYDHNERFKKVLNDIGSGIYLKWGRKASHHYKHAYVLNFGTEEGTVYTIQTNYDLDVIDNSSFSWVGHDLFQED